MKRKLALLLITTLTAAAIPFSAPALAADVPSEEISTEAGEAGLSTPEPSAPSSAEEETVAGGQDQEAGNTPAQAEDSPGLTDETPEEAPDPGPSEETLSPEDVPMETPEAQPVPEGEATDEAPADESAEEIEDLQAAELEQADLGTVPKITSAGWYYYNGGWHLYYVDPKDKALKQHVSEWMDFTADQTVTGPDISVILTDASTTDPAAVPAQPQTQTLTVRKGKHFFDADGTFAIAGPFETPDAGIQYFDADGFIQTGWVIYDGVWHYFEVKTGLLKYAWKYLKEDVKVKSQETGKKVTIKKGRHFFDENGSQVTDNVSMTPDKGLQFFNAYGVRKVGYIQIDGKWYHFKKETGMDKGIVYLSAKTVNGTTFGKGYHYFNTTTGVHVTNAWADFEGNRYRLGNNGAALTGWQKLDGAYYHFTTKGVMEKNKTVSGVALGANGRPSVSGAQVEMMLKVQSVSSRTGWLCCTDKDNHRAGFFKGYKGNWTLVRYWPVAVGAWYQGRSKTPSGTYRVAYKQYRMTHLTSFYYVSWTSAGVGYHSKLYSINVYSPNNPIVDNSMAVHVTNGCMRLDLNNAKWVYDTVPNNSAVYIYGR